MCYCFAVQSTSQFSLLFKPKMESAEDFCDDTIPQGERWAPLGAAEPENEPYDDEEYWTE